MFICLHSLDNCCLHSASEVMRNYQTVIVEFHNNVGIHCLLAEQPITLMSPTTALLPLMRSLGLHCNCLSCCTRAQGLLNLGLRVSEVLCGCASNLVLSQRDMQLRYIMQQGKAVVVKRNAEPPYSSQLLLCLTPAQHTYARTPPPLPPPTGRLASC